VLLKYLFYEKWPKIERTNVSKLPDAKTKIYYTKIEMENLEKNQYFGLKMEFMSSEIKLHHECAWGM